VGVSDSAPPLRVLQLVHAAQRRGAEVFASDLANSLRERGHHVERWALHPGDRSLEVDRMLGLAESSRLQRVMGVDPQSLVRLTRAILAFDPDIIQLNGASTVKYGAAVRSMMPRRPRWRLVYRNIGSPAFWLQRRAHRLYYRHLVMPRMDGVIALTSTIAAELRAVHRLGWPIAVIPNAVAPARIRASAHREHIRGRLGIGPSTPVVAFVGALSAEKAPARFVEMVQRIDGVVGWVIGDGPLRAALEARARGSERLRFHGAVEDVGGILGGADLLVCPSDSEGIPAAVLEAGLLGLPTVASAVGGLPSCVVDGRTGLLVPVGDINALTVAVRRLAFNENERRTMGDAARAHVEAGFTIDSVAGHYERFYRELLGARP
jgi:glycosyltransferase involved in cell wall biosynthesis